jgi:hypothetical protein
MYFRLLKNFINPIQFRVGKNPILTRRLHPFLASPVSCSEVSILLSALPAAQLIAVPKSKFSLVRGNRTVWPKTGYPVSRQTQHDINLNLAPIRIPPNFTLVSKSQLRLNCNQPNFVSLNLWYFHFILTSLNPHSPRFQVIKLRLDCTKPNALSMWLHLLCSRIQHYLQSNPMVELWSCEFMLHRMWIRSLRWTSMHYTADRTSCRPGTRRQTQRILYCRQSIGKTGEVCSWQNKNVCL